jgi:hypothetical protein
MNTTLQEVLTRFETAQDSEKLQHVLIEPTDAIEEAKRTLHSLRYATIDRWSPVIPMPGTPLYMSVLTRHPAKSDR